jgi:hypothetical protein
MPLSLEEALIVYKKLMDRRLELKDAFPGIECTDG